MTKKWWFEAAKALQAVNSEVFSAFRYFFRKASCFFVRMCYSSKYEHSGYIIKAAYPPLEG